MDERFEGEAIPRNITSGIGKEIFVDLLLFVSMINLQGVCFVLQLFKITFVPRFKIPYSQGTTQVPTCTPRKCQGVDNVEKLVVYWPPFNCKTCMATPLKSRSSISQMIYTGESILYIERFKYGPSHFQRTYVWSSFTCARRNLICRGKEAVSQLCI